ncbi:hypothetical protein CVU37_13485 [candidate division BRC1 bacterium HGW-BRC1-1]|jgi:thioredoxin-related protein|nr:MAG: hypothetical protein CVU37_13485 [candidate division BRC1 bacterium HGW-BRC1-1]
MNPVFSRSNVAFVCAVTLALTLGGCAARTTTGSTVATGSAPLAPGEIRQLRPSMAVDQGWQPDLGAAQKRAQESGRLVVAFFAAPHCPPCVHMKTDVLPQPAVQAALAQGEAVMIDTQATPSMIRKYAITGTPTLLVMDGAGREISRTVGYVDANQVVAILANAGVTAKPAKASKKTARR